jgi:hypothetical protein
MDLPGSLGCLQSVLLLHVGGESIGGRSGRHTHHRASVHVREKAPGKEHGRDYKDGG